MTGIKDWAAGIADEVVGVAKRAAGEFGARPDLVLDGEEQQARGRAELAGQQAIGWKLDRTERQQLIARFPPAHAFVLADHVTLKGDAASHVPLPPSCRAEIVGRIDDGAGVEAMIVAVEGGTERPDGGTYHITWSLGPGRKAEESNEVIARLGWHPVHEPIAFNLIAARLS